MGYRSSWFMTDVGRPTTTTFCLYETSLGGGLPDSTSFYFTPLDGWNLERSASHVGSSSPLVSIDSPTPLLEGFYHICSLVIANGGPFDTLRMFSKSGEAMGYDGELWTAWLW